MALTDDVRAACAEIARTAQHVRIDVDRLEAVDPGPPPELDRDRHYLEGAPEDVADFMLMLDSINFGSGWFPTLRKRPGMSGYFTVASGLTDSVLQDEVPAPKGVRRTVDRKSVV